MKSILETRFQHIVERLRRCWGSPEAFNDMFNDLVFDSRSNRSGWPEDVWEELQFLQKLHKAAYEVRESQATAEVDDSIKWL